MGKRVRIAALLPLTLLLWACPKEHMEVSVQIEAGRPVFDGDRDDCIIHLHVMGAKTQPGETWPWSVDSPLPVANDRTCRLRFPVSYGAVIDGINSVPRGAPLPLQSGRRYQVYAEGTHADHFGEFLAP